MPGSHEIHENTCPKSSLFPADIYKMLNPHISPGESSCPKMRHLIIRVRLTMSLWASLHSVLGNCSMRCSTSCIPAVVSGFWNNLAAELGRSPLNHSYGYMTDRSLNAAEHRDVCELPSVDDHPIYFASLPQQIGRSRFNSRRLARRAEGRMPIVKFRMLVT